MKIEKWTPIAVTWIDAYTIYSETTSKEFNREYKRAIRRTIGWLIVHDRERIVVAMEDDRQSEEDTDVQTVTTIPLCMVQGIVVLRDAPTPKPRKKTA